MKLRLLGMVILLLTTTNYAFAGLLLDPYIGVGQSKVVSEVEGLPTADSDESYNSNAYGARIGWTALLLAVGIDYQVLNFTDDDDDSAQISTTSAFVGVGLPMIRFWAEYMLSSEVGGDDAYTDLDADFTNGYGIGVGFTGFPLVSFNLELETLNYEYTSSGYNVDTSVVTTLFTVSFPINI